MKLLYTALISLCVSSVSAQFTLNASNYGVIGTTHEHEHAFWGDTLDLPLGPNQSWDFSGVISDQTRTITYINPADSEAGSAVNGSTIVLRQEAEVEWSEVHYAQNGNQLEEVYVNLYDGYFLDYSEDPKTMMTFPANYGDSMTDTYAGSVSFPGEGAWARTGEQTIYLAGHGSLTLPYGTINNVMLVRVEQAYADDFGAGALLEFESIEMFWFHQPTQTVLAYQGFTEFGGISQSVDITWLTASSVSVEEFAGDFVPAVELAPNPAADRVQVTLDMQMPVTVEVMTLTGAVVRQAEMHGSAVWFAVADLPRGIYLVRVQGEHLLQTRRLILE